MVLVDRPSANTRFVRKEERQTKAAKASERHRAGKAPEWGGDGSDEEEMTALNRKDATEVVAREDRRLARVEAAAAAPQARRRRVREAEVVEEAEAAVSEGDDEDFDRRRANARAQRQQAMEVPDLLDQLPSDGSESEYEEVTESESEEHDMTVAVPMFVDKKNRVSHLEKRKLEVEDEEVRKKKEDLIEKRRQDTRRMIVEDKKQRDEHDEAESDGDLPDDSDDVNEAQAYEEWKLRELTRIMRYKEERQKQEAEKLEMERRRNLSDDARKQENIDYDKKLIAMGLSKKKAKMNFMQKYHHKGGFFQDTIEKGMEAEAIYRRDTAEAVGSDRFNKELLPHAMHVRGNEFGKRGQTKWTHLTAEDTTYAKDRDGNMLENAFVTTTFSSSKSNVSASQAHQLSENYMMFRHAKPSDVTPLAPGSAQFGTAGKTHKDNIMERPAKRSK